MSDSVRPQRRQPTRLPSPWDSPGKNTGVGCHFLLQCMKVKSESEVAQSCPTPSDPMDCSLPGSSIHGICLAPQLEETPETPPSSRGEGPSFPTWPGYSCTATCIWVSSNRRDPFWNKRLQQAGAAARPAAAFLLRGKFGRLPPLLLHLTEKVVSERARRQT